MSLKNASVGSKKKKGLSKDHPLRTRWYDLAKNGNTLGEYPRPMMVRANWTNLNGYWDYAITKCDSEPDQYDGVILVPFSPECALSGVHRQLQPDEYLWYRKDIPVDNKITGFHDLLHFGAVDQECAVYVNGKEAGFHQGGYLPFTISLRGMEEDVCHLVIRVRDLSDTSYHSRGKQKLHRGGMFYTAQSGIWQTVWMERVPDVYIKDVKITPDYDHGKVSVRALLNKGQGKVLVMVREEEERDRQARDDPNGWVEGTYCYIDCLEGIAGKDLSLSIPDFHPWSPEDPYLYHLTVKTEYDQTECYFGMRVMSKETAKDGYLRFFLNHKEILQVGVLDQGYWPEGLYTAPSDEALIYDIETMKKLGCNMLRKHLKIEPQRWYYHCDRLGMLVWQDMVNGGRSYQHWFVTYLATVLNIHHIPFSDGKFSRFLLSRKDREGRRDFKNEVKETIRCLYNHPCIVNWVPFNESWGQFDAKNMCETVRRLDATRLIDHASGWFDQKAGDIVSLHYYFFDLHFKPEEKRVLALTEYGGYSWHHPQHSSSSDLYGYGCYHSIEELNSACKKLMEEVIKPAVKKGISGLIYTQLSDIEDEANGILTYDREVIKIPDLFRQLS